MARPTADEAAYLLPETQARQIFHDHIVPSLGDLRGQPSPQVLILSAQPGSGKTTITAELQDRFADRGGLVGVEIDMLKPFHPRYRSLIRDGVAHDIPIMADARRWLEWSLDHVATRRANVVAEHSLHDRNDLTALARRFASAGYEVTVALMGTPRAASRLGILARYQAALERSGSGRYYPEGRHDQRYDHLLTVADWADEDPHVSSIEVYRRGHGDPVHRNRRDAQGRWRLSMRTRSALTVERNRRWGVDESARFLRAHHSLSTRMAPSWHAPLASALLAAGPLLHPDALAPSMHDTTAITYGRYQMVSIAHLDTVRTMLQQWPRVVVGVLDLSAPEPTPRAVPEHLRDFYKVAAANTVPDRNPMSLEERVGFWRDAVAAAGIGDRVSIEVVASPGLDPATFNARFPPEHFDLVFPAAADAELPHSQRSEILGRPVHTVDPPLEFHTSAIRAAYRRGDPNWERGLAPGTLKAFLAADGPDRLLTLPATAPKDRAADALAQLDRMSQNPPVSPPEVNGP